MRARWIKLVGEAPVLSFSFLFGYLTRHSLLFLLSFLPFFLPSSFFLSSSSSSSSSSPPPRYTDRASDSRLLLFIPLNLDQGDRRIDFDAE